MNGRRGFKHHLEKSADGEETTKKPLRLMARFRETDEPGVYTVRLLKQSQVTEDRLIAYNTAPVEGDLVLISTSELRKTPWQCHGSFDSGIWTTGLGRRSRSRF